MGLVGDRLGPKALRNYVELHNRSRTCDLRATYTNGQKRYLSSVGRDYELHKAYDPAYRLCYGV